MKKLFAKIMIASFTLCAGVSLTSCQDKDIEQLPMVLNAIDASTIQGQLVGDDYVITWPKQASDLKMQVTRYANGTVDATEIVEGEKYEHKTVDTNIDFTYVLKVTDGKNLSKGSIHTYTRQGATKISGLMMSQMETAGGGYDAKVEWTRAADADKIHLTATNGTEFISASLLGNDTQYIIPDVKYNEEWSVTIYAENSKGNSLKSSTNLKIGKTLIGFLCEYDNEEDLTKYGDDDEQCAWLWLKSEYPTAKFVPFSEIKSAQQLDEFRVLFWLRDLENVGEDVVLNMSETVKAATPFVKEWYMNGGSLLLWSHAMPYVENLGRIPEGSIKGNDHTIGTGVGGWNPDVWRMAVCLSPGDGKFKKDHSGHPIFKGLEKETTDRTVLIAFKGAGWTEDHNCLFFNLPSALTGIGNQEEACYNKLVDDFGIVPLGTWDSQINWVSQLNVWEAKGIDEFKGTILCIGNGGCEFSMKNADGSYDISARPKNNPYQENVLTLAKNSLEYLKTK